MTETESKWAERVRQWRASGKTADQFATGQEFRSSTLRYWASELNRRTGRLAKPKAAVDNGTAARMQVVRVKPVARREAAEAIVVTIGGARVEVRAGFDRALLRELVDALGAAR
jgi:transposase